MTHRTNDQDDARKSAAFSHNAPACVDYVASRPARTGSGATDRHRRAQHSPGSALTPTAWPAHDRRMPLLRVRNPKAFLVGRPDLPREVHRLAWDLHCCRNNGYARAASVEHQLIAWLLELGETDELVELPCCDACGQALPQKPATQARIALAEAACSSLRIKARAWKRGAK